MDAKTGGLVLQIIFIMAALSFGYYCYKREKKKQEGLDETKPREEAAS